MAIAPGMASVVPAPSPAQQTRPMNTATAPVPETLNTEQQAIVPLAAFAAAGDMVKLNQALNQALDAGLSINAAKEVLVQLYAYAGFPRSLNALAELMTVVEARKQRGIRDAEGPLPGPLPTGNEALAVGTANQTKLAGAPVKGPLYDFAPAIDQYLKAHLFGDIFARDNLDWRSRELATVAALSAMSGVEAQLRAHLQIGMNTGLTATQLRQLPALLEAQGATEAAQRVRDALQAVLK